MLRYASYSSPHGKLFIAATEQGICSVTFDRNELEKGIRVKELFPGLKISLSLYFKGARENFDYPLDLSCVTPFTQQVLTEVKKIPYGRTKTYGEIAGKLKRDGAQRAVGSAIKNNPIPILIPCHRVVAKDSIGGYTNGVGTKLWLLLLEKTGTFSALISVIERLRRECPWDRVQTHHSLVKYLKEETEEVIRAIEEGEGLAEELGDLLLQVLVHAEIATDFDIIEVCERLTDKLKTRHPHVFGKAMKNHPKTPEDVKKIWEEIKSNKPLISTR